MNLLFDIDVKILIKSDDVMLIGHIIEWTCWNEEYKTNKNQLHLFGNCQLNSQYYFHPNRCPTFVSFHCLCINLHGVTE